MAWTFEVSREDSADALLVPGTDPIDVVLREGETLLSVERVSMTANNVTYAKVGEMLGYWRFFPVDDPERGIVPAWGFARVVRTTRSDIAVGQRVYGYLPMATHLVARLEPSGGALIDRAAHRAPMAAVYNSYSPATDETPHDDHRALLQPLLLTSFLLDGHLGDQTMFGASRVVLSSASSKTALGLAWMLKRRGVVEVVGLSSPANIAAIVDTACYDRLVPYPDTGTLAADGVATVFVDFAGDATLTLRIHGVLGDNLVASIRVGGTHWEAPRDATPLPGVTPSFFFAPDHARERMRSLGEGGFHRQLPPRLGTSSRRTRGWRSIITRAPKAWPRHGVLR